MSECKFDETDGGGGPSENVGQGRDLLERRDLRY